MEHNWKLVQAKVGSFLHVGFEQYLPAVLVNTHYFAK